MKANITIPPECFNERYLPLLYNKDRYLLFWGGRGGAKSYFAAQKLIIRCLTEKYFRYILVRKHFNSIKDTQWQTIKDIVIEWGLEAYFQFNKSPLEITCVNGNKFLCRGLDEAYKTKSIKDPTGIWYEEANEITEDDFNASTTSIRTTKSKYIQEILTFNPECTGNYEDFWLYKKWFKDQTENSFRAETSVTVEGAEYKAYATSLHVTYKDNKFISQEYKAQLESLSLTNPYYYNVYTLGNWGKRAVKSPWAFNFDRSKHISERAVFDPKKPVYFSFDFNVEPFICNCFHIWTDKEGHHFHGFREIKLEVGDVYKMANRIKELFPSVIWANAFYTGDASARNRTIEHRENWSKWMILTDELKISKARLQVPRANPFVKDNQPLVNAVLALHPDWVLHPSMTTTINEFEFTEGDEEGNILKKNRAKEAQRADGLDNTRYAINTWMFDFIDKPHRYYKP